MSFYLFYKYYQIRKENLGLNKFLIAFGLLYGFGFSGIVLRSFNSYFIENLLIRTILNDVSHILISIAAISFLIVVSLKDFKKLINEMISRILALITVVISILILIIEDVIFSAFLIFSSIFIGVVFMIYFHFKLIQKSTGSVKNRILFLFIGEILIVFGIIFGTEINPYLFTPIGQEIVRTLFTPLVILGQLIVFYAFYDFPVFLEFNWQKNLIKLYIISKNRRKVIYNYNFITKTNDIVEDSPNNNIFFSKGIIGIEKIISMLTKTEQDKIQRINQDGQILLFNYGTDDLETLIFCINVSEDMISTIFFLKMVKELFQNLYKNVLNDLDAIKGSETQIFNNFNDEIRRILSKS